jgi:GAF domain-containing protein
MNAEGASILELAGDRLRIVGSHGLSPGYRKRLDNWPMPLAPGRGPAGLAVRSRAPILSTDATSDPRFTEYAELIRTEGYTALASMPLITGETVLGTLTLYRREPGEWSDDEVRLLAFFADHAATAVRTAQLIAEQKRQVSALERLVLRLREQTHEHANRLHAIGGLLAMGDTDEALEFVRDLTETHISDREVFERQPSGNALAGLLWVEMILARQRSIELQLDVLDDLDCLPLTDAQALTIVGNLLDNAFDAVADADADPDRRRVQLTISETQGEMQIRVRDWGPGMPGAEDLFAPGYSTKSDHTGVGLTLVRDAAHAARGRISIEHHAVGVAVVVTLNAPGAEVWSGGSNSSRKASR